MKHKDLDMQNPKKKVVSFNMDTFKNKHTGEIVEKKMGETYTDGSSNHKVYNARDWKLINSRTIKFRKVEE